MNNNSAHRLPCLLAAMALAACGGSSSGDNTTTPTTSSPPPAPAATAPTISTQPADASTSVGGTATFSVTAAGTAPLTYQWQKSGTAIAGATEASYTTPAAQAADNGTIFTVVVTNSAGSITSNGAKLTVNSGSTPQPGDVVTYKNDLARTGQYPLETTLTPANVNSTNFGLLRQMSFDGKVDGLPLYLSQLTIGGAAHNVVFADT